MNASTLAEAEPIAATAQTDVLRQMVQYLAQRLIEVDVQGRCGASYDEKSAKRQNSRNGYRDHTWDTRAGGVELKIPKLRQGSYYPEFLDRRRTAEKALIAVVQEACVQKISARSADDLAKALRMSCVPKSQVSQLCSEVDVRVAAFLNRPIVGEWPYLWINTLRAKVPDGDNTVHLRVLVAAGANSEGRREVLGLKVGASTSEPVVTEFLQGLVGRGLQGVQLVISDRHAAIKGAAARALKARWQCCRVDFMRDALALVDKAQRPAVSRIIGTVFAQASPVRTLAQWDWVIGHLSAKFPKVAALMDATRPDLLAFMSFPNAHWAELCRANPLELPEQAEPAAPQRGKSAGQRRTDRAALRRDDAHTPGQAPPGAQNNSD